MLSPTITTFAAKDHFGIEISKLSIGQTSPESDFIDTLGGSVNPKS